MMSDTPVEDAVKAALEDDGDTWNLIQLVADMIMMAPMPESDVASALRAIAGATHKDPTREALEIAAELGYCLLGGDDCFPYHISQPLVDEVLFYIGRQSIGGIATWPAHAFAATLHAISEADKIATEENTKDALRRARKFFQQRQEEVSGDQ